MANADEKWYQQNKQLRSAGELVAGGGTAGAVMTLLYVMIGIGIWSLVGYGLDHLLGTSWIVWAGAAIGAFGGIYLVFIHMQQSK
ncbi:hypothetical protein ACN082_09585 [Rothia sp. CCM 9417]|uniref:hypothetical protein n=1 Tax=unclassified Rothia (in: high G+C Gram-positive bacteria) TaxID=2689056 RepID=UPI003ACA3ED8